MRIHVFIVCIQGKVTGDALSLSQMFKRPFITSGCNAVGSSYLARVRNDLDACNGRVITNKKGRYD